MIKKLLIIVALASILLIGACSTQAQNAKDTTTSGTYQQQDIQRENATMSQQEQTLHSLIQIPDGDHTLNFSYADPQGEDSASLSISVSNGMISSIQVEIIQGSEMSHRKAQEFNQAAQTSLVGKSLSELDTTAVIGGASLTSKAVFTSLENYHEGN